MIVDIQAKKELNTMAFSKHDLEAIYLQSRTSLGSVLGVFAYTLKFQAEYKLLVMSSSSYNVMHFPEMLFLIANCFFVSVWYNRSIRL